MNKFLLIIIIFVSLSFTVSAQSEKYSRVLIYIDNESQINDLIEKGVMIDHFSKSKANSIDVEISTSEIDILINNSVRYEILVDDVKAHYQSSVSANSNLRSGVPACGLQNFDFGTMGHYHTNAEVVAHLDSMKSKYPTIITDKINIGNSIEGNPIYAVKISDNPDSTENATEGVVYFDALHHAREPMSMESILYYMWWLLENYNSDPEATYLVNNRELHFVPIVNPDGYIYNQTTDPMGGGNWRKNRRNSGGGDFGVDLNRNYSSAWGNPLGSSSNPASGTYHGTSAFSEPESQAIRDYYVTVNPALVFSLHAHGQKFLVSPGCFYPKEDYEGYAEFSSEFVTDAFFGYGTTFEMLNYSSCGTSRHYMHDQGAYAWVPELGSGFWPPQSEFCSTIHDAQYSFKYISYVSGSYTRLAAFDVLDSGYVSANDTLRINVKIKNRGVSHSADSVSILAQSLNANCIAVDTFKLINTVGSRAFADSEFTFVTASGVNVLDTILLRITIREKDYITFTGIKKVIVGKRSVLFEDDAESGTSNWTTTLWDTTFMDSQSGAYSFADSRYGNYEASDDRVIRLNQTVDLSAADHPYIQFNAKWSISEFDVVTIEISTNGTSWSTLKSFNDHKHWTQQCIDLSNYVGQVIYLRFRLISDNSVQSDGFYFDDFKVVDFETLITGVDGKESSDVIRVYPNPANDHIQISSREHEAFKIELFSCIGNLLHEDASTTGKMQLTVNDLPNGIYFIRVHTRSGSNSMKIVKQ